MAVLCSLRKTSAADLTYLRENPGEVVRYLFGEAGAQIPSPPKPRGFFASLGFGRGKDSEAAGERVFPREAGDAIDMEKSWEVVDYLLTGSSDPGPIPLHLFNRDWPVTLDVDVGYGNPMVLDAQEIGAFADELSSLSDDYIWARFDPVAIRDEKLEGADAIASQPDEARAYLTSKLAELRRFASTCRAESAAAILYYH